MKKKLHILQQHSVEEKKMGLWVPVDHITQPTYTYVRIDTWHWLLQDSVVKDGKPKPLKSD